MVISDAFWKGKKVFLTGHTGFKGSWLSLWLQHLGAEVTGFALAPHTQPSLFDLAKVARGMTSIIGDIRHPDALRDALQCACPELVIHMAAQPLVRQSYRDPVETYSTNVMGTVHLLEAVRHTPGIKAVIIVTSDKCYENKEWHWGYRENEPLGGYDPYSNSKGCAELITASYRNSFFNPFRYGEHGVAVASARAGNVIGGGDWAADRLIPDMLRAFYEQRSVHIRNPHAIRPWQHVLEPLSGYLTLARALYTHGQEFAEAWNFGPPQTDARSVEWIVDYLSKRWDNGAAWDLDESPQPHEASYLKLDCAKAHDRLQWSPRWPLETALEKIVEWHKRHIEGGDMRAATLQQIEAYQA